MSEHKASIQWKSDTEDFNIKTYNPDHEVRIENGVVIPASAAVDFNGNSQLNNPEDLFVASVMGCHMLTFLVVASIKKLQWTFTLIMRNEFWKKTVLGKW
jgi:organic hydroperoxide reductase OsmC/OhrA